MKNLLLLGLALVLFVSCKQEPPRWTNSSPEIDVVKALQSDYEKGDWQAWAKHYADTAKIYHNSTEPGTVAELMEGFETTLADVSTYAFAEENQYHEMVIDDKNEKWVNMWATWKGVMKANDKEIVIPVHLTLKFVDGAIVEEHGFYDMSEWVLMKQEIAAMAAEEGEESEEE